MLYLVTGGSGSGKSEYAENLVQRLCQDRADREKWYLATMIPYGAETKEKIARHRSMRKEKEFLTKECYLDLKGFVQKEREKGSRPTCILLECMSNLTANEMFEEKGAGKDTFTAIAEGVKALCTLSEHVVVVTNEVCSETAQDSPEMLQYKCILGTLNCWMGKQAAYVTEVVYGAPMMVKEGNCLMEDERKKEGLRLIIGGAFQGKIEYVKRNYPNLTWCDGETCDLDVVWGAEGILHLEAWIRRWMQAGREPVPLAKHLLEKSPNRVIVCTEIGYGLVPVDPFDRRYREAVGRICTELGESAVQIERIVCGIPTVIKQIDKQ